VAGLVVGITGSAGKTTTKELVADVFASTAPTLRTQGNLNNHWGVPLTLLALRPEHQVAIVEIAMSNPGEDRGAGGHRRAGRRGRHERRLRSPRGARFAGGDRAREGIAGVGARQGPPGFRRADSPRLVAAVKGAPARVTTTVREGRRRACRAARGSRRAGFALRSRGFPPGAPEARRPAQVQNALAALAWRVTGSWIPRPSSPRWRPTPRSRADGGEARGRGTLLVDCYNANPDSMAAALGDAGRLARGEPAHRVAGDMLELGETAARLHREAGALVRGAELWTVGAHAGEYAAGARRAGAEVRVFGGKPEVSAALREVLAPGVVVLLKASRGAALEQVLDGIEMEN